MQHKDGEYDCDRAGRYIFNVAEVAEKWLFDKYCIDLSSSELGGSLVEYISGCLRNLPCIPGRRREDHIYYDALVDFLLALSPLAT